MGTGRKRGRMTETIKVSFEVVKNTPERLVLQEKINEIAQNFMIKKAKLLDDYIYKNLETSILQGMKLKIENELLERKLKNNGTKDTK